MNNWQEWVVGVLVVLCIARVVYGIFLFFRRTRLQPQTRNNGSLDEWLSQRSAKPCTAVRIRQEPHEALSDVFWKGFSLLLTENGTTLVLQN